LIESSEFKQSKSKISFAVGKDISGKTKVADIAKMPHLLIAGATGSGKSVCINTIIMSILYKAEPDEVKLLMIDPKVVELSVYNGIPHLMIPVVTDPKKASAALHWAVAEMTERYDKFAQANVREINGYNEKVAANEIPDGQKMPQIVIIVDELADLMMVASGDVEESICRLAQLARAAGIHLVIATQRPSVNVITGLIKANMPSRIAFAVTSGVDSRTILDMNGAEKLLGKGDMLFHPQGIPKPVRVQGAFVSDKEVSDVVEYIVKQNGAAQYNDDVRQKMENIQSSDGGTSISISDSDETDDGRDIYFSEAAKIIADKEKASIGMLQRYLKFGFNRAARIMDQLEEAGIVGPEEGTKPRKVLMSPEELQTYLTQSE
ncbi:MAG: DNA translocase FtsK, partial [Lachnospiraceae bacterium]|nr:DNA translocase FtsK [Lachnospiraceae bacterium]